MGLSQMKMSEKHYFGNGKKYTYSSDFKFHGALDEDSNNGLVFNNIYIPEEVLLNILSYVSPDKLLNKTLVCKKWCNLIKSDMLWRTIYARKMCKKSTKKLPWYVYYSFLATDNFKNLIRNGNGQEEFQHWNIIKNFGDEFKIEPTPAGSEVLPQNIPEFNDYSSCFATSFYECNKVQIISLNKRLLRLVLDRFKPHIYVSEWIAGRFDCGCKYKLIFSAFKKEVTERAFLLDNLRVGADQRSELTPCILDKREVKFLAGEGVKWRKVEMLIKNYEEGICCVAFEHEGRDTQFWKGHYGAKMAGGVVQILFDTIEEQMEDD